MDTDRLYRECVHAIVVNMIACLVDLFYLISRIALIDRDRLFEIPLFEKTVPNLIMC